jgi:hypothetical protein
MGFHVVGNVCNLDEFIWIFVGLVLTGEIIIYSAVYRKIKLLIIFLFSEKINKFFELLKNKISPDFSIDPQNFPLEFPQEMSVIQFVKISL